LYHSLLGDAKLYEFLLDIDADLAARTRSDGCPQCGGVLHSARYPRKPRGGPGDLGDDYERRLSFCCAEEGCRRRRTPPSVRFLGRKVYLAAVVVLATAMQHGVTARRVGELQALLGIGRRTLLRWRTWWQTIFAASPAWRARRGLLGAPAVDGLTLPLSLVERFLGDERAQAIGALRFLAPLTTTDSGF
jgi:hypothetical protein